MTGSPDHGPGPSSPGSPPGSLVSGVSAVPLVSGALSLPSDRPPGERSVPPGGDCVPGMLAAPSDSSPARRSRSRRDRTRSASSAAAFLVNVRPSTRSGRTIPLATSQTSRAAMVSLLPDPAPAITAIGPSGAPITTACSAVGSGSRSTRASCAGLYWTLTLTFHQTPLTFEGQREDSPGSGYRGNVSGPSGNARMPDLPARPRWRCCAFGPERAVLSVLTGDLDLAIHEGRMLALSLSPRTSASASRAARASRRSMPGSAKPCRLPVRGAGEREGRGRDRRAV
jgi:hypothetical protein